MSSPDCPFCRIAAGLDDTVEEVCRSEAWVAFFPDSPATPGHTLVIPRRHIRHLWEAEPGEASELMAGVLAVGGAVLAALLPQGMNLITSAGVAAEQSVPHLHLHVVPRWSNDRIDPIWPPKRPPAERVTREIAHLIRQHCPPP